MSNSQRELDSLMASIMNCPDPFEEPELPNLQEVNHAESTGGSANGY